jgi:hypothetical protein
MRFWAYYTYLNLCNVKYMSSIYKVENNAGSTNKA